MAISITARAASLRHWPQHPDCGGYLSIERIVHNIDPRGFFSNCDFIWRCRRCGATGYRDALAGEDPQLERNLVTASSRQRQERSDDFIPGLDDGPELS